MKKLIAIAALMCGTAHAEFFSGNELLRRMTSGDAYERGTALGYVLGAHDTGRGAAHCSPEEVTAGQVRDMVKAHLDSNPETRHMAADSHIMYVLKKVWPCKKTGGASL
jgi:hypothetical protein